jgi:DNA-damage-inducible protein D
MNHLTQGVCKKKELCRKGRVLPMVLLKARDFANEITHTQLKQEGLCSEAAIAREQVKNSRDVRKLLIDRGIVPQELPRA